uniref:Putative secreted protein n=1 Tax=Ixodes ricinus TaxID=34613 RepID=A0A6B0U320_IXORI
MLYSLKLLSLVRTSAWQSASLSGCQATCDTSTDLLHKKKCSPKDHDLHKAFSLMNAAGVLGSATTVTPRGPESKRW